MRQLHCTGISLIELMLSLLLGSILLLSVIHLLANTTEEYQQQQRQIRQLENWRTLDFIFNRAIHMAGFFGCRSPSHTQVYNHLRKPLTPYDNNETTFPPALLAYHVDQSKMVPIFIRRHAKLNSDVLIVNNLDTNTTVLQQDMLSTTSALLLHNKLSLKKNDVVIINDCQNIDVFAISSISGSKNVILRHAFSSLNASNKLSKTYSQGTQLGKFTWQLFYLRKTKNQPLTYGLYRQNQRGRSEELLDHVEDMRLYFALKNKPSNYIPVTQVHNWQQVEKVKIIITLPTATPHVFFIGLRN